MSKKVLSIFLAIVLAATIGVVAKADVAGKLDFLTKMRPQCPVTPADPDKHIRDEVAGLLVKIDKLADLITDIDLDLIDIEAQLSALLWKARAKDTAQTPYLKALKEKIEKKIDAVQVKILTGVPDLKLDVEEGVIELIFKLWKKKLNGMMTLDEFVKLVRKLLPIILRAGEEIEELPDATWAVIMDKFTLPKRSILDSIDDELAVVNSKLIVAEGYLPGVNTALAAVPPVWTDVIAGLESALGAVIFAIQKKKPIYDKVADIVKIVHSFRAEFDKINPPPKPPLPRQICKMDFDIEAMLKLNITISGLTFFHQISLGVAGIEHYIASISTILGALSLKDTFVFAAPYDAAGQRLGGLQFVKKKVDSEISIAGLTVRTKLIFDDINFDYPYPVPLKPPAYRFGGWIDISGETISGIKVRSLTAICADPQKLNRVKKWSEWGKVVCKDPELEFTVEKIWITGIPIGPLTIDKYLVFRPLKPISLTNTIRFKLLGFDVKSVLYTEDITKFPKITKAEWTAVIDIWTLTWDDKNGSLTMDAGDVVTSKLVLDIKGAKFTSFLKSVVIATPPLQDAWFEMSIPVPIGKLTAKVDYSVIATELKMDFYEFKLSSVIAGLGLDIGTKFKMTGMEEAKIKINIPFSL